MEKSVSKPLPQVSKRGLVEERGCHHFGGLPTSVETKLPGPDFDFVSYPGKEDDAQQRLCVVQ